MFFRLKRKFYEIAWELDSLSRGMAQSKEMITQLYEHLGLEFVPQHKCGPSIKEKPKES